MKKVIRITLAILFGWLWVAVPAVCGYAIGKLWTKLTGDWVGETFVKIAGPENL